MIYLRADRRSLEILNINQARELGINGFDERYIESKNEVLIAIRAAKLNISLQREAHHHVHWPACLFRPGKNCQFTKLSFRRWTSVYNPMIAAALLSYASQTELDIALSTPNGHLLNQVLEQAMTYGLTYQDRYGRYTQINLRTPLQADMDNVHDQFRYHIPFPHHHVTAQNIIRQRFLPASVQTSGDRLARWAFTYYRDSVAMAADMDINSRLTQFRDTNVPARVMPTKQATLRTELAAAQPDPPANAPSARRQSPRELGRETQLHSQVTFPHGDPEVLRRICRRVRGTLREQTLSVPLDLTLSAIRIPALYAQESHLSIDNIPTWTISSVPSSTR